MIIGQAPGRLTVERDLMFGGPSGLTLEHWLQRAGFAPGALRREVYLTALTRCDPGRGASGAGDRKPSPAEVALCHSYLERELALVHPRAILLVGGMAITALLGSARLEDLVGSTFERDGRTLIPLPHPSGVSRWLNDSAHQALVERALARLAALRAEWKVGAAEEQPDLLSSVSVDKTDLRESTKDE
jgi:uracil-DNA glycosylase